MEILSRSDIARWMRPAVALVSAILAGAAFAASHGEHREHEAHEHGHGTLDIVVEGEEMVVEFRVPAVNVVGFEHVPRDDAEREAVRRALVPFGDAASVVVVPPGAGCEVEEEKAGIRSMTHEGGRHDDGEEHDHEGDRHETHETDEQAHDAHREHEEPDPDSDAEAHSELHATYRFHCHVPERLDRVDVRVFEHLRDAEEFDVRVVTPSAQLAMELHPDSTVVELAP